MTLQLWANELRFDKTELSVPAGVAFAIELDNREVAPHNVVIRGPGVDQRTEPFSGPAVQTYVFAGLPAGDYVFLCDVHPEMSGVLESGG